MELPSQKNQYEGQDRPHQCNSQKQISWHLTTLKLLQHWA